MNPNCMSSILRYINALNNNNNDSIAEKRTVDTNYKAHEAGTYMPGTTLVHTI